MAAGKRERERSGKNRRWEGREEGKAHNQRKINEGRDREDDGIGIQKRSRRGRRDDETEVKETEARAESEADGGLV